MRTSLIVLLIAACGFPRPRDVGDDVTSDASMPGDTAPPGIIIHVSPSGDDANDGRAQPVKTLKRAIAIAGTDTDITTISLDAGRYTTDTGEKFPYTVPANVAIVGSVAGGSVLGGTRAENGLTISSARLQDLELDDFATAIAVTGTAALMNVQVQTSMLAIRAETMASLSVVNLAITGAVDTCGSGIELYDTAAFTATTLTTRNLVTAITAKDMATVDVTKADVTGDPRCTGTAFFATTGKTFTIRDSSVVGTYAGMQITGDASSPTQVTLMNTTIRNTVSFPLFTSSVLLTMIDGQISNNPSSAESRNGQWTLMNVKIDSNGDNGIFVSGTGAQSLGMLTMRNCTLTNNRYGISLFDFSVADLGTDANPGNNVFQNNQFGGVSLGGTAGPQLVNAVGNTWNPGVQGSDNFGRYSMPATVSGPIQQTAGNNYDMWAGLSLRR